MESTLPAVPGAMHLRARAPASNTRIGARRGAKKLINEADLDMGDDEIGVEAMDDTAGTEVASEAGRTAVQLDVAQADENDASPAPRHSCLK